MNVLYRKIALRIIDRFDTVDMTRRREFIEKEYGIKIGKYTYGYNFHEIASGTCIGAFCSFASGVKVGQMNHPMTYVSTHPFLYYANRGFLNCNKEIPAKDKVVIGDDVWIGNNAMILPGVKVARGAVIAAGCVVTKDVPPYAVMGGVPGSLIKWRFEENIREKLRKIDWPNWDDGRIKDSLTYFYDPASFIKAYEDGVI